MFTITDVTKIPASITSHDFDTWFDKFNTVLRGIGLPIFTAIGVDIRIVFSDKAETSSYGSLSIEELKNQIMSNWGSDKGILAILQHIKNHDDYRNAIQDLMGAIERIRQDDETLPSASVLHTYLDDLQFSMPVMGRYTYSDRTITLFTKNVEAAAQKHGNTSKEEFEQVFIHELFHAYHYIDRYGKDRKELGNRVDYTSKVVKESLASAFEWNYCILNRIIGYDSLHNAWSTYSILSYPYSGAIELLMTSTTSCAERLDNKKFCEVFELSLIDMDGALRQLVPNDFYDIKNLMKQTVKKQTVPLPNKPNVYKINSGKSFRTESTGGYIFAPADNYHKEMRNVRTGDILLQIFGGKLHSISLVTKGCYYATAAHGHSQAGYYADAIYMIFPVPIDILQFKSDSSYPIRRNEPYIRAFRYPDFIRLILNAMQKVYPQNTMCASLIAMLIF